MMTIHLPPDLAQQFHVQTPVMVDAFVLDDGIALLNESYPGILAWLIEADGRFRENLSVFIGGRRLAPRSRTTQAVADGAEIWILRAISGG